MRVGKSLFEDFSCLLNLLGVKEWRVSERLGKGSENRDGEIVF